jgi:hypothetical protein
MPRTVSSPGPKRHSFCGRRGFRRHRSQQRATTGHIGHKPRKILDKFEFATEPKNASITMNYAWRRGWDSNPRYAHAHNGFRDRPVRPLRHPSAIEFVGLFEIR